MRCVLPPLIIFVAASAFLAAHAMDRRAPDVEDAAADRRLLRPPRRHRLLPRVGMKKQKTLYRYKLSDEPVALKVVEDDKKKESDEAKKDDSKEDSKEKKEGSKEKSKEGSSGSHKGDIGGKQKLIRPPKEDKCQDLLDGDACSKLEPLCQVFLLRAYVFCKKTCKLCNEDEPEGVKLVGDIPELKGRVTLQQCAPRTTVFLTVCLDKDAKEVETEKEYAVEIHDYATIKKGGTECTDIGPEFNPYNVKHGGQDEAMKKVGDLGNIKFLKEPPKAWPKEKKDLACKQDQIGAYALYNHVDLYVISSVPAYKPIVIHEKRDKVGNGEGDDEGNLGKGLLCARLLCHDLKKKMKEQVGGEEKNKGKRSGAENRASGKPDEDGGRSKKTTPEPEKGSKAA